MRTCEGRLRCDGVRWRHGDNGMGGRGGRELRSGGLLNMAHVGGDALVEIVRVGVAEVIGDLDRHLAKEGQGAIQGLSVFGNAGAYIDALELRPEVGWQALL